MELLFLVAVSELVEAAVAAHQRAQITEPVGVVVEPGGTAVTVLDRGAGEGAGSGGREDDGFWIARTVSPGLMWRANSPRGSIVTLPLPDVPPRR